MKFVFLFFSVLLICSCSTRYQVTTNTFADVQEIPFGFPRYSSFAVISNQRGNPLFAKDVSQKIERNLISNGYRIEKNDLPADFYLFFDCMMVTKEVVVDIEKTKPSTNTTKKGFVKNNDGTVSYEETVHFSTSKSWGSERRFFFAKELSLSVFKDQAKTQPVWSGSSTSTGPSDDLREALDYLIVSAFKYFGADTIKQIVSVISKEEVLNH